MQLQSSFNPMDYDPSNAGMGGLPVGKHPVVIKSAELKPTSDGQSGMLELELEIIDGPSKGATGAYRLNLYNKSEKAARIAHSQLSALCHVTGQFQLGADGRQLSVLFNIPFVVEVGMQAGAEAQEKGYTEVKKVFDTAGNEPGKRPAQGQQQAPQGQGAPQQGQQGGWGGNNGQQGNAGGGSPNGGAGAWGGNQGGGNAPAQGNGQGWGGGAANGSPAGGSPAGGNGGGWQQGQQGGGSGGPSWGAPR